jgi:phage baseplate assembly protein W
MISLRSSRITSKSKQREFYSDFTMDFDLNPITGSLTRLTNEESVKASIVNLVMTQRGERFYHPNIGSEVKRSLFNPFDELTAAAIQESITATIGRYEPRAQNVHVQVIPNGGDASQTTAFTIENNYYICTISFTLINIPNVTQSIDLILQRVR